MSPSLQTQLMTRKTRVTEDYWGKICVWWRAPIKVMTLGNCWFDDGVVELFTLLGTKHQARRFGIVRGDCQV